MNAVKNFTTIFLGVELDTCVGSCNALNDLSKKPYVSNKTEDLYLSLFNMIRRINERKAFTKHISCKCKCKWEKDYIWNPSTCGCENGKYLGSVMDDSAIMRDEVIQSYDKETKTVPTNFNEKKKNLWNAELLYFTCIFIK